jgi:hypothetical protein
VKTAGRVICLQIRLWQNLEFVKGSSGLERIGGLRELEDLRGPFIVPAMNRLAICKRGGPLIKGSRDSVTAANFFTALIFSPQGSLLEVRFASRQNEQGRL